MRSKEKSDVGHKAKLKKKTAKCIKGIILVHFAVLRVYLVFFY